MSASPIDVMKDSLGTIFDAGGAATTKVTFDRDVFLGMHEDGVERATRNAGATAIAQIFTDHHCIRLGIAYDSFGWTGLHARGL